MLSILVLVLGVVGGVFLGADRVTQQRSAKSAASQTEANQAQDVGGRANAVPESTDEQNAQHDAQQKADSAAREAAAQEKAAADASRGKPPASRSDPRTPPVQIPTSCSAYKGNQAIGCALLAQFGFRLDQMPCLQQIWLKESGWNEKARNPSSGAYGIAQASPASKMSVYGSDYLTNPATQIKWGLSYIKGRYSSPCGAWSFWQSHHWY
jgi:cytoskeletal protein RodZ